MKCFIVYRDELGLVTVEIDPSAGIQFTANGGFINYETETDVVQDETKNIVEIYFEK